MPITRKQQVLAQLETTEGGGPPSAWSASHAIQVYDPSISDSVDQLDRTPAGPTLSRDFTPTGRRQRDMTFTSDFRGSGTPATAPEWNALLQCSGYKKSTRVLKLTCGTVTGGPFQIGEQVTQDSGNDVGVVIACFTSANVPKETADTSGDYMIVAEIIGTLATSTATTGASSSASTTVTLAVTTNHHAYLPTSEKLIQVTISGAFSTADAAAGDTLNVLDSGDLVGAVQVVTKNSSTSYDVVLLTGSIANGNTLDGGSAIGTATISAAPTMTRTPSLALRHNLDGRNRDSNGSRASFTLGGEVGQPMVFSWNLNGSPGTDDDGSPITTSGLSTVRAPRLLGAICAFATGSTMRRLQTKSISFDNGGTISPNLDANSAGGATGANITDRDSSLSVTVDNVNGAFDWEALRDAGTVVRAMFLLGTVAGNVVALIVPNGQVTEVSLGDSDGVSTMEVTIKPRRIAESGDDDIIIAQL